MKFLIISWMLVVAALTVGCSQEDRANRGFSLPEGSVERGQQVFLEKACIQCHTLSGPEFSKGQWEYTQTRAINVTLGGEVRKVQTYGDLVSSVINPSHRIAKGYAADEVTTVEGESRMRNYNDVMTVTELVDLVTFLKTQYKLVEIPDTSYPPYVF